MYIMCISVQLFRVLNLVQVLAPDLRQQPGAGAAGRDPLLLSFRSSRRTSGTTSLKELK